MKKFLLMAVALFIGLSAQAWTVYFTNPDNWATPCIWAWNGSENFTGGTWPGMQMTKEGDVWTFTGEGEPTYVIFNNNGQGSQTGDLDFEDGATYNMYGPVGAQTTDYEVLLKNEANWDAVYVYTFSPELFGAWPGKEMTLESDGLYKAIITATSTPTCGGIIFNNGGNGLQTDDLTFEVGKTYTNGSGEVIPAEPLTEPAVVYWDNTEAQWEKPLIYYWGADELTYPGVEMTKVTDNIYTFTVPVGSTGMLFNAGGDNPDATKTEDFYPVDGHVYTSAGDQGEYVPETEPIAEPATVYWDNTTAQWETPLIYFWGKQGDIEAQADVVSYPGVAMTKVNDTTYSYTVPAGTTGMLFNAGGDNPDATKTADFYPVNNHVFTAEGDQGVYQGNVGVEGIEVAEEGEAIYFNMLGARVLNPTNGIFIKVVNGKASKVVVAD